jgi:type 1 glutamine amidotransferase
MPGKILFVGGCIADFHMLESAEGPVREALEAIGLEVDVSGIYHPGGGTSYTGDYTALRADNLRPYDAVVLFTTGSDGFGEDIAALLEAVRDGKALIGIHCATDSFTNNPEFVAALGAQFRTHPAQIDVAVEFLEPRHPITEGLKPFTVHDELYLFRNYDSARVRLLAQTRSVDDDGPVPVCWVREEGAGRVFYLSLGHNPEVMADPAWQVLFQRGTQWALGDLESEVAS